MKTIKHLVASLLLLLVTVFSYAQSPDAFNYQAVLRDSGGSILANEEVEMRFRIRSGSENGSIQYWETIPLTTNQYGVVNHVIGEGAVTSGEVANVTWSSAEKFLQVELDAGDGFENLGTQQLVSVPYALQAKEAQIAAEAVHAELADGLTGGMPPSLWGESGSSIYNNNSGNVGIGTASPVQKLDVNGRINVNNGVIQRGGGAITSTSDLGLYSRVGGNHMRFVTNDAAIQFFTNEGPSGIGGSVCFEMQGNASSVNYWTQASTSGIDNTLRPSADAFGMLGDPDRRWYRMYASTYYGSNTSIQSLSDRSLKTNVVPMALGMASIMQLRPVSYDIIPERMYPNLEEERKIDDRDLYGQLGFIAQEVEEVFPGLVREWERKDGEVLKTVGYAGLIPVMIKGMQEQQAQIEELKAEIEALKKK